MASKKKAAPKAASDVPEGHLRIYPTHRRGPGPLVVGLPAVEGNSDELQITDEGADVPKELARHLIDSREATTEPPKAEE